MTAGTGDARTFLFAPGNRPERFARAAASGADVMILDLGLYCARIGVFTYRPDRNHRF
jgi:hypothetical protein